MIEPLILHEDAAQAAALFARTTGGETVYRPLNEEEFYQTFIRSTDTVTKVNVCEKEGDTVLGFASGAINAGKAVGYITMIVVDRAHRRDGMGTRLLAALETELHKAAPIQSYEITFFNPVNLTWIVPGTPGHDHPNAPGIDVASDGYLFFKNNGYLDTVYQNSFYQPLAGFAIKPKIQARIDGLREHDLAVGYYDKERHFGMEELFDDLGNPLWKTIKMESTTEDPAFNMTSVNYMRARDFRISVTYRFGTLKDAIKKVKRGISNDDVDSNNGGGGDGMM